MKLNKMKTTIIAIAFLISGFILGACGEQALAANDSSENSFVMYHEFDMNKSTHYERILSLVDNDTGVNYIVVTNGFDRSIAITPRLNADGTLYTSE